jgi:acylphosphatase
MNKVRLRLIIKGKVQGVFFRESTRRQAQSLGVTGWVRNLPDGSVEAVAEGSGKRVGHLVEWCRHGPPMARVDNVHEELEEWTGDFSSFEIVF